MKFDKPITKDSWVNVEGWSKDDIETAAKMFVGQIPGARLGNLEVYGPYKILKKDKYIQSIAVLSDGCIIQSNEIKRIEETSMKELKNLKFRTNNLEHRNIIIDMLKKLGYTATRSLVNMHHDCLFVYANQTTGIKVRSHLHYFDNTEHQEVDVSWMDPEQYKEKRETIRILGKTVYKEDLEKAINNLDILD